MKKYYTIGMDYGTLSCRGVLVDCDNGNILASAEKKYSHGVMDRELCDSHEILPIEWALEHPMDYIEALDEIIPLIIKKSGIDSNQIIGIGIDFTSCTMMPIDENAVPLCMKKEYAGRRNAYVKLWKHHGAQKYADQINDYLNEHDLTATPRFGGKVSSELLLPKTMELLTEDPEIYTSADEILEAGDWLTRLLTGKNTRSCSMAGYKAWWNDEDGYPENEFYVEIDPQLDLFVEKKMPGRIVRVGEKAGVLTEEWAKRLGLPAGIAVAPTIIDSHAGVPGSCVCTDEQMLLVLGTSSVMLALSKLPYSEHGILGGVRDAVVPGYYALESGLASVGDLFGWFIENMVPESYGREAYERNIGIHELLCQKASSLRPGQSGLLALDWWNGNKTPFVDGELKGVLIGMSLNTKPEEIYRSLIEATAYGTRQILELYEKNEIVVDEIICSGGIALKNPMLMQIYADVLGKHLKVADSDQAAALGSAIYAALSAGKKNGGYDIYQEAVQRMSKVKDLIYSPDNKNHKIYNKLYSVYKNYSKIMGKTNRDIIRSLKEIGTE